MSRLMDDVCLELCNLLIKIFQYEVFTKIYLRFFTHFMRIFHFYISSFLMFSGAIEMKHWREIGQEIFFIIQT